jgi:hypothetical protein
MNNTIVHSSIGALETNGSRPIVQAWNEDAKIETRWQKWDTNGILGFCASSPKNCDFTNGFIKHFGTSTSPFFSKCQKNLSVI